MPRVTMFVANDLRIDSRVRREAAALAATGLEIVVTGVLSDAAPLEREEVDGYTIVRVAMPRGAAGGASREPTSRAPSPSPSASTWWRARRNARRLARRAAGVGYRAVRPVLGESVRYLIGWRFRWGAWAGRVHASVLPSAVWHAHDLNTLQLALDCAASHGGRVVYDSHEIFTEAGRTARLSSAGRRYLRRLERQWAAGADAVITVNASLAARLSDLLGIDHVAVVHNAADIPADGISPLRAAVGVTADVPLLIYHGSMVVGRGVEDAIRALGDPSIAAAHLVLMGSGPLLPDLETLARELGVADRVHLRDPVPPDEVTRYVAGADVAVMPIEPTTLNHRLSSPNKMFEAIAAGVPVVAPNFVEFRRIVLDAELGPLGVLYAEQTPRAIAGAIATILDAPRADREKLRARVSAAAFARWNWERESRNLLEVYRGLGVLA